MELFDRMEFLGSPNSCMYLALAEESKLFLGDNSGEYRFDMKGNCF